MDAVLGPAKLRFGDGRYEVLRHGAYVVCAITGDKILLPDLSYWSVARQEPYVNGRAALAGFARAERAPR